MPPSLGHRGYLGAAQESVWGTAETSGFAYAELLSENIQKTIQGIPVPQINTTRSYKKRVQGKADVSGPLTFNPNPDDLIGLLLKNVLWGQSTIAQVATITIGASNNKLDFNIGAGTLTATIASSTYKPGNTQADTGTLCKAIYDAIVAAEAVGTYTVSFSNSTKKFTITRSAGTFQLVFLSGASNATSIDTTIGFTHTDHTGALTYTSDSALTTVLFNHPFITGDTNPGGLTLKIGRDADVFDVSGGAITSLAITAAVNELLKLEAGMSGRNTVSQASAGSPSFSTLNPFVFHQGVLTLDGGSANVTNFNVNYNANLKADRHVIGSQYILQQQPGMADVTGTFTQTFEGAGAGTVWAKFVAGTAASLVLTFTGDAVGASFYKLIVTLPNAFYDGPVDPVLTGPQNELFQTVPFRAIFDATTGSEIKVELINARGTSY